jgi:maltose alpha-D-glucosyltransferase/alpha-amylase
MLAHVIDEDGGRRIRIHGDYHLGQVLRGPQGDLFVIDFEGEPMRPIAQRRTRWSPLRDVAGMLRSFGYAAARLVELAAQERTESRPPPRDVTDAGRRWEEQMRRAFLAAYLETAAVRLLPRTAHARDALLELFELEKLFYELAYELRSRPAWVHVPLGAILHLAV